MSGMFIDLMDFTKLRKLCEWNCATECIVNNYFLQCMLKDVHFAIWNIFSWFLLHLQVWLYMCFVISTFNYFLILFIYFLSSGNDIMIGLVFWRNYFLIVKVLLFQQKTLIKAFYIASLKNVPFVCCILKIFYF